MRSLPPLPTITTLRSTPVRAVVGLSLALVLAAFGAPAGGSDSDDEPAAATLVAQAVGRPAAVVAAAAAPAITVDLPTPPSSDVGSGEASHYVETVEAATAAFADAVDTARVTAYLDAVDTARVTAYLEAVAAARPPVGSVDEIIARHFGPLAGQARAIVHCESKGDPGAVSATNDHGLFQINHVHRAKFTEVTGQPWSAVYDPEHNTRYAKFLHDEAGWRPWTCRKVL